MKLPTNIICAVVITTVANTSQANELAINAAHQQIRYARMVAEEQQTIDSDHYDWMYEILASATNCDPESVQQSLLYSIEEPVELTMKQSEELTRYLELNCQPYEDWILETIDECDVEELPSWCESAKGLARHLNLSGYLDEFVVAIEGTSDRLERYNVLFLMTSFLGSHFSHSLPEEVIEPPFASAARSFLETATFDEVLRIVTRFQNTALGLLPQVRDEIINYAGVSPDLDPSQRKELVEKVKKRWVN